MIESSINLLSGVIVGFILFQSVINAPLLFKTLEISMARPLLRAIFPMLFKINTLFSAGLIALAFAGACNLKVLIGAAASFILSLLCALAVPYTNRAADAGNQRAFKVWHAFSVVVTMIVLVVNIAIIYWL